MGLSRSTKLKPICVKYALSGAAATLRKKDQAVESQRVQKTRLMWRSLEAGWQSEGAAKIMRNLRTNSKITGKIAAMRSKQVGKRRARVRKDLNWKATSIFNRKNR